MRPIFKMTKSISMWIKLLFNSVVLLLISSCNLNISINRLLNPQSGNTGAPVVVFPKSDAVLSESTATYDFSWSAITMQSPIANYSYSQFQTSKCSGSAINSGTTTSNSLSLPLGDGLNSILVIAHDRSGNSSTAVCSETVSKVGAHLLSNLNRSPANVVPMIELNGYVYFAAATITHGVELWRTNGTAAGASLVADINVGPSSSNPSDLTVFNGALYFVATTAGSGRELWKTDGSVGGTVLIKDIQLGTGSSNPSSLLVNGAKMYFAAETSSMGKEPYVTDGSTAGTVLLKRIGSGTFGSSPKYFTALGSKVVFSAFTSASGHEPYVTDGTTTGTFLLKEIYPGSTPSSPEYFTVIGTVAYFAASAPTTGTELYATDGTTAGTSIHRDIVVGSDSSNPKNLTAAGGNLFFTVSTASEGRELWMRSAVGTVAIVKDIRLGSSDSFDSQTSETPFIATGAKVIFRADDSVNGNELWISDGSTAGTYLLKNIAFGAESSDPSSFLKAGSLIYFAADDKLTGRELYRTDGTPSGTERVADLLPGVEGSTPTQLFFDQSADQVYFYGAGTKVADLFVTDGTAVGSHALHDGAWHFIEASFGGTSRFELIQPGKFVFNFQRSSGGQFYSTELSGSTTIPLTAAHGTASDFLKMGNRYLYASGGEPYLFDYSFGTDGLLKDLAKGFFGSRIPSFTKLNDARALFFTRDFFNSGSELWVTDLTAAGTSLLNLNYPENLTRIKDRVVFSGSDSTNGRELWISDGTVSGTQILKDIAPGSAGSSPSNFTLVGEKLYFTAWHPSYGRELWVTDGTAFGTFLVKDLEPGSSSSTLSEMTNFNDTHLIFGMGTSALGYELYQSRGTSASTALIKEIQAGSAGLPIRNFKQLESKIYFTVDDGINGEELWESDLSAAGTKLTADICPGVCSSSPTNLERISGKLVFAADDGISGREPWRSDGSISGTYLINDVYPGPTGSSPATFTDTLDGGGLMIAESPFIGKEIFRIFP